MEADIEKGLREMRELLEKVYRSTEKTRKYFLWTLIVTAVLILLPLGGLLFVIPQYLRVFSGMYGNLLP